jgi:hypothetical protein
MTGQHQLVSPAIFDNYLMSPMRIRKASRNWRKKEMRSKPMPFKEDAKLSDVAEVTTREVPEAMCPPNI